jgi:hypothetical protein
MSFLSWHIIILIYRLYVTFVAFLFALIGAESRAIFIVMVAFGLAVDILRHRFAPDLVRTPAELANDLQAVIADEQRLAGCKRTYKRFVVPLIAAFLTYVSILFLADIIFGSERLAPILRHISIFSDLFRPFVPNIGKHEADLAAHGYEARAIFVPHVYAINTAFWIVVMLCDCFRNAYYLALMSAADIAKRGERGLRRWPGVKGYPIRALLAILYPIVIFCFFAAFMPIQWDLTKRNPHALHVTDAPLIIYTGSSAAIAFCFGYCYVWLILYRARATAYPSAPART